MSGIWFLLAALACALIAAALRERNPDAGDRPTVRSALVGALLVGAFFLALAGLDAVGKTMSLAAQVASSVAIGIAILVLMFRRKPRTLETIASALFLGVYLGVLAFEQLRFGWNPDTRHQYHSLLFVLGAVGGLIAVGRRAIVHWRDEDALVDQFGAQQGYIQRREVIPIRVRAVLMIGLWAVLTLLLAWLSIDALFPAALPGAVS